MDVKRLTVQEAEAAGSPAEPAKVVKAREVRQQRRDVHLRSRELLFTGWMDG